MKSSGAETDLRVQYRKMGISDAVQDLADEVLNGLRDRFARIDETAEFNQLKVLAAMQQNRVSEACLYPSTGYGYNDIGRDTLEKVYASIFHTEDALVRPLLASGTHALHVALSGNLRPGDELLAPAGGPYDTLEEVIGIRPSRGSLAEYGVKYAQVDLLPDGGFDYEAIRKKVNPSTRMALIQRSKGYQTRLSFSVEQIGDLIAFLHELKPDLICMVDNCYGEFVQRIEPGDVGADLIVGSLIKNPGGGLAPIGGYIAGRKELVENAAYRLTAPGLGKEVGATLGVNAAFYQGLFLSPVVTASALKGAVFAAALYEKLGFSAFPPASAERYDIIQALTLGSEEAVCAFCRGIQAAAPVDSFVVPEPWPMPGYDSDVIMAAGAFVQGSSIELSADAPIRPPYTVFFQGGQTWPHARFGILKTLQYMKDAGLIHA
ncbi:MAG: methionine gamma-lyase family protein [Eubacterium sp.]|nr:methionine gamma-lyase family protein [Eubacterium sp.]